MLVADIGNTDILFGVFDASTLIDTFRIPSKNKPSILPKRQTDGLFEENFTN